MNAETLFSKAIQLEPDYAEAHRELGSLLLKHQVLDEAEYHLRRAVELNPADPWARLYLDNLLWRRNDIRAAVVEFQWAYQSEPNWPVTMWCLADIYSEQEGWARAEELYHRALAVKPDDIDANRGLAKMYMRMGRAELAKTYFGRVLLLDPGNKRALECMEEMDSAGINRHEGVSSEGWRIQWEAVPPGQ